MRSRYKIIRITMVCRLMMAFCIVNVSSAAQSVHIFASVPGSAGTVAVPLLQGATVWLDPLDDTATITIDASQMPSCQSVTFAMNTSYTDANTGRSTSFTQPLSLVNGGYVATISVVAEGGDSTLSYKIGDGQYTVIPFTIAGQNLTTQRLRETLRAYAAPPYFGNMLNHESSFRQFVTNGRTGFPLIVSNPDGIGIGQWDGVANAYVPHDGTYWSTYINIQDNLALFDGKMQDATAFWKVQLAAWQNDPNSSQITPPVSSFQYCTFSYPSTASTYGYDDGTAIQYYNTKRVKFIRFYSSIAGQPGYFQVDSTGYTASACGQPAP